MRLILLTVSILYFTFFAEAEAEDDVLLNVISCSQLEIEMGKLAVEKSESQELKELAQKIVRDYSMAADELRYIAQNNHIKLPEIELEKYQLRITRLCGLSGSKFDEVYLKLINKNHKENADLFERVSKDYNNEEIQEWAEKNLTILEEHRELAETLRLKTY